MKSQGPSCERSRPTNVWMKSVTLARTAGMVWLGWLRFRSTAAIPLMVGVRMAQGSRWCEIRIRVPYPIGNNLFHDAIQHKPPTQTTDLPLAAPWLQKEGDGPLVIFLYRQNVPEERLLLNYDTPRKHGHQNSHNWEKISSKGIIF